MLSCTTTILLFVPFLCLQEKEVEKKRRNIFSALSKDFGFLLYFGGLLGNIFALEILKPKIFHGQNFHKLCMTPNALANAGLTNFIKNVDIEYCVELDDDDATAAANVSTANDGSNATRICSSFLPPGM